MSTTTTSPNIRYLDTLQRSEEEYSALKDQIKAAKAATKKVLPRKYIHPSSRADLHVDASILRTIFVSAGNTIRSMVCVVRLFFVTGRVEEARDGESGAEDVERGGSRKRDAPEHQESGENYNKHSDSSCEIL